MRGIGYAEERSASFEYIPRTMRLLSSAYPMALYMTRTAMWQDMLIRNDGKSNQWGRTKERNIFSETIEPHPIVSCFLETRSLKMKKQPIMLIFSLWIASVFPLAGFTSEIIYQPSDSYSIYDQNMLL